MQVKNVQHKQETRFQSSSMEEGAMKYYSASDRRTGEGVQGFGFGNVATGQVVQKKLEFLQRAGSVGRGDSRDGLNPDIRSPTPSQLFGGGVGGRSSPRVTVSESRVMPFQQGPPPMATSAMQQQQQQTSSSFSSSSFSSSMGATSATMQTGGMGAMQSTSSFSKKSSFSASSSQSQTSTMVLQKPPTPTPPQMFSPPPIQSPHSDL